MADTLAYLLSSSSSSPKRNSFNHYVSVNPFALATHALFIWLTYLEAPKPLAVYSRVALPSLRDLISLVSDNPCPLYCMVKLANYNGH